jgi:hypothetical protein
MKQFHRVQISKLKYCAKGRLRELAWGLKASTLRIKQLSEAAEKGSVDYRMETKT